MINWMSAGRAGGGSPGPGVWIEQERAPSVPISGMPQTAYPRGVPQVTSAGRGAQGSPGEGARAPPSAAPGPEEVRHGLREQGKDRGNSPSTSPENLTLQGQLGWPGSPAHPLPCPHRGPHVALAARDRSSPRPGRPAGRDAAGRGRLPASSRAGDIYRESKEPPRLHSGPRWGGGTPAASLQPPQSQPPTLPVAPCDCGPRGQLLNGSRRAHPAHKRPRRIQVSDARACPRANAPCTPRPAAALAGWPRRGFPAPGSRLPAAESPARPLPSVGSRQTNCLLWPAPPPRCHPSTGPQDQWQQWASPAPSIPPGPISFS